MPYMHVCQDDLTPQFVYSFFFFFFFFQPAHSKQSRNNKRKATNRNANSFKTYMEDQDVYYYLDQENKHELRDESRQATRWKEKQFLDTAKVFLFSFLV